METFRQIFNIVLAELVVSDKYVAKNTTSYIGSGHISINKYKFWECDINNWAIQQMIPGVKGKEIIEIYSNFYKINPKMELKEYAKKDIEKCWFKRHIPAKLQIIHEGNLLYERDWKPDEWVRRKQTVCINLTHLYNCPTSQLHYILPSNIYASNQWKEYTLLKGFKKITVKGASGKGVAKETKWEPLNGGQHWLRVPDNPFSIDGMELWLKVNGIKPKKKYEDLKQQVIEMCKVI